MKDDDEVDPMDVIWPAFIGGCAGAVATVLILVAIFSPSIFKQITDAVEEDIVEDVIDYRGAHWDNMKGVNALAIKPLPNGGMIIYGFKSVKYTTQVPAVALEKMASILSRCSAVKTFQMNVLFRSFPGISEGDIYNWAYVKSVILVKVLKNIGLSPQSIKLKLEHDTSIREMLIHLTPIEGRCSA
jgi:hypothetical protein